MSNWLSFLMKCSFLFLFILLVCIGCSGGGGGGATDNTDNTVMLKPKPTPVQAPPRTVGLIKRDERAYEGYTLFKPLGGTSIYLLNNAGNPVHKWTIPTPAPLTTRPGGEVFLRKNGELVLTAEEGIYALNPDSSLAWKIDSRDLSAERWFGHHEVVELPNGNMLLPGFIEKSRADAETAGFDVSGADVCNANKPNTYPKLSVLRVDNVWELAPTDPTCGYKCGWQVVWRWNLWDHFVQNSQISGPNYVRDIADYPEKSDMGYIDPAQGTCGNYIQGAWTYGRFNALGYNASRDEIVMSSSLMNEIWIINHKITTEQARGSAGDLLYRWGNPYAYGAGNPFVSSTNRGDQKISFQHRVFWISQGLPGEGHLLIFNNGTDWGESSVIELVPPTDGGGNYTRDPGQPFGPADPVWAYKGSPPSSFFAALVSSAQRLPNGNTLINDGPKGYLFEVTSQGEKVWEYVYPPSGATQGQSITTPGVYRAWRYAPDFPGLAAMSIIPADPLEIYPKTHSIDINLEINRESQGVLPLVIYGSAEFDVTTVDPYSILLEGFAPATWSIEDVGSPETVKKKDGYPDLTLKYDMNLIKVALGNASVGDKYVMRLTGYSTGAWFKGNKEVLIEK